jgi:hypothetical protein
MQQLGPLEVIQESVIGRLTVGDSLSPLTNATRLPFSNMYSILQGNFALRCRGIAMAAFEARRAAAAPARTA